MDKKQCKKCNLEKDIIFFHKDISKKDGHRNSCKNHYANLRPLCSFINRVIKREKVIYG